MQTAVFEKLIGEAIQSLDDLSTHTNARLYYLLNGAAACRHLTSAIERATGADLRQI